MTYNAPLCNDCWDKHRPDHPSPRLDRGAAETCDDCGNPTNSGIYQRRHAPPILWKKGQAVEISLGGRTVNGTVTLASPNAKSLMLSFEAILGGYAGMMPTSWDGLAGSYVGLVCGSQVTIEPVP